MNCHKDAFLDCPGHLYPDEGYLLQKLFAGLRVLDIGTHHGRSAVAIAATASHVTTLDWGKGDHQIGAPDAGTALRCVQKSGLSDRIHMVTADWTTWTPLIKGYHGFYTGIFYDAAHTSANPYEADFLELMTAQPDILIALHDYKPWDPSMREAVAAVDAFEQVTGRNRLGPEPGTSVVWFLPKH